MWAQRAPVFGGFMYRVFADDIDHEVLRPGTCYLYGVGWHPEMNAFVSTDDDAILWRHGLVRARRIVHLAASSFGGRLPGGVLCDL